MNFGQFYVSHAIRRKIDQTRPFAAKYMKRAYTSSQLDRELALQ